MDTKQTKLLVGLGNPGEKYSRTRHNLGFYVLDSFLEHYAGQLSDRQLKDFSSEPKLESLIATVQLAGTKYILAKPQTYMNLSGRAVQKIIAFYHLTLEDVLVVHDEKDLPLGKIRLSRNSSAGGHNGVRSIISSLGTQDLCRLRVGISQAGPDAPQRRMDAADFVLQRFTPAEMEAIAALQPKVIEAISQYFESGFEKAASVYNAS